MSVEALERLRSRADVSHEDLAKRMGLTDEEYGNLISGRIRFRRLYGHALDRAALSIALEQRDPSLLNPQFQWQMTRIVMMILQESRPVIERSDRSEEVVA